MLRMGVNSRSDGDGVAPVPHLSVPWCGVPQEEQQVLPTGQVAACPS